MTDYDDIIESTFRASFADDIDYDNDDIEEVSLSGTGSDNVDEAVLIIADDAVDSYTSATIPTPGDWAIVSDDDGIILDGSVDDSGIAPGGGLRIEVS